MGSLIQNKNLKELGMFFAKTHNMSINEHNAILFNGWYLNALSQNYNMPFYKEINETLIKTDTIIKYVTSNVLNPHVNIFSWYESKEEPNKFGNPALDLGALIYLLESTSMSESFLRSYINNGGILITIIELQIGMLYIKLYNTILNRDIDKWESLAKNECHKILHGKTMPFTEISADILATIGLPGLMRV